MKITENIVDDLFIQNSTMKNQDKLFCNNISYTCLIDEIEIDRANVPEELFEYLDFNENILKITKDFWENLAKIANIKGSIHNPQKCYSFINSENCVTISSFSFNPYKSFFRLKGRYASVKRGNNLLKLKKEALVTLNFYLKDILPIFDTEIKKLEISIISYDENDNHETVFYKYSNLERAIERHFIRYLADIRKFVSNFSVRSRNGNEPAIKRILKKVLQKTYDNVNSRINSLEIESTSKYPNNSIKEEATTFYNVSETTQQIGCNELDLTTIPSISEILNSTNAFLTDNTTLASTQQEVTPSLDIYETRYDTGFNDLNLTTTTSITEIVNSTNVLLTDNTALASIHVHPVMAISAILIAIFASVFGLLFLRRKRSKNQKKPDNYDLVINDSWIIN